MTTATDAFVSSLLSSRSSFCLSLHARELVLIEKERLSGEGKEKSRSCVEKAGAAKKLAMMVK